MLTRRTTTLCVLGAVLVGAMAAGVATIARQGTPATMAGAADAFIKGLTPEQRQQAVFPLESEERLKMGFIPTNMLPRNGLPLKAMNEGQRGAAHALLASGLSQRGYMTATAIMDLESVLHEIEAPARAAGTEINVRDSELYYFSVFGTPAARGRWAMRVEGHHLSLHFSLDGERARVTTAPIFLGSNPAEIRVDGPKRGTRVLAAQMDAGRALLDALTPAQRTAATIAAEAPRDIQTATRVKVDPLSPAGLMASDMTTPQRELLVKLIDVYVSVMADDVAAARTKSIREAGLDGIAFAWAGSYAVGERYHYRVQGPTFLIEHNNTQTNGNHIHSVWRDFNGDFGRDVLTEHLAELSH